MEVPRAITVLHLRLIVLPLHLFLINKLSFWKKKIKNRKKRENNDFVKSCKILFDASEILEKETRNAAYFKKQD